MSGSERRPRAGHVQLDSRPILPTTDGNENITEADAFHISRQSLDPAVEYKMNHQRRGVALIFNHEHFFWHLMLPDRRGTMADRNNLKRSLTDLGFEVRLFDDLKAEDVQQKIYEDLNMTVWSSKHHLTISASMDDHSNADCFVCVFLSHGVDDHVYAYDDKIKIQTITDMFRGDKCQSLVGKPKIFILQENASWEVPQEVSGPASCSKQSHGVKPGHAGLYPVFIQITISKLIYEPGLQQIVMVVVYRVILSITFFFSQMKASLGHRAAARSSILLIHLIHLSLGLIQIFFFNLVPKMEKYFHISSSK
ncbi:caspase-6 isoform 3-T3 [Cyanocitta cristata]